MRRIRRRLVTLLKKTLIRMEPGTLILPPSVEDYSGRNFGRPVAQTGGYFTDEAVPGQHEQFGHIRLWNIGSLAKEENHTELPLAVKEILGSNNDILDVACGFGNDGVQMMHLGNRVWGLDIIAACVETAGSRGICAERVDLNVERFPFEDGRFDRVTSFDTIEHLYHWRHFVSECLRVLKPEGLFVCSTFNAAWVNYRRQLADGTLGFGDNNIRHFSTYALRRWLIEDFGLLLDSIYPDHAPSILFICRRHV